MGSQRTESGLAEDDFGRLCDRVANNADSVLWTYKAHFKAADNYAKRSSLLDWGTTVGAAMLTVSLIWNVLPVEVPVTIAILTAIASGYKTASKPQKKAETHYRAGEAYLRLFDDFRDFIKLELSKDRSEYDSLEKRYQNLSERRKELNDDTPQIHSKWYRKLDDSVYEEVETTDDAKARLLGSI